MSNTPYYNAAVERVENKQGTPVDTILVCDNPSKDQLEAAAAYVAALTAERDALREALQAIVEIAVDAQGDWHSVQVPYVPSQLVPFQDIENEARAALLKGGAG